MGKKLERLSSALGSMLKARGLQGGVSEYRIFGQWDRTVGQTIARHARPQSLRGKKLFLTVDSPAWMQQLSLLKLEIIEKVNRSLGKDAVSQIALNLGPVPFSEKSAEPEPLRAQLSAEERAKIEQYTDGVHDVEVKKAIRRVIEKDLQIKKAKHKQ